VPHEGLCDNRIETFLCAATAAPDHRVRYLLGIGKKASFVIALIRPANNILTPMATAMESALIAQYDFVPIADGSKGGGEGKHESLMGLLRCRKTRFRRRHYAAVIVSLMEETAYSTNGRDVGPDQCASSLQVERRAGWPWLLIVSTSFRISGNVKP
jgi:hypothetical protein